MTFSEANPVEANPVDVLKRNSRSFSIAALFLPLRIRGKIQHLYAWCRAVDDAVDHADSPDAAERELGVLERDLRLIASVDFMHIDVADAGQLQHPASRWIASLIRDDGVDVRHAVELIEGMRIDLRIDRSLESIDSDTDLLRYCYHAAGTVGLMMSQIMGVTGAAARPHAVALGVAMQLTNIARDVREDADRGRCYLPGITRIDDTDASSVRDAVGRILSLAESRYDVAAEGLNLLPRDCRRAIRVALAAYREIGREITRRDGDVLAGRTIVPKFRLMSVVTRAALAGESVMTHTTSSIDQCKHAVWLGLSLTAFMATALFAMVYFNPKSDAYSSLPMLYAAASLTFAVVANRIAARYETTAADETLAGDGTQSITG